MGNAISTLPHVAISGPWGEDIQRARLPKPVREKLQRLEAECDHARIATREAFARWREARVDLQAAERAERDARTTFERGRVNPWIGSFPPEYGEHVVYLREQVQRHARDRDAAQAEADALGRLVMACRAHCGLLAG